MVVEHEYPMAPRDLFAVLTDPQYLAARHERFGGVGTPEVVEDGTTVQLRIGRQLPMDKIPSAARGLVGDGRLVQVDEWDTGSVPLRGEWHAEVDHAPVVLGGANEISVSAQGSRYAIGVLVKVKVPLIGRQLEGQVRGYLETLVAREQEYLAQWIAERPGSA
jgi:hypothetical protein